MRELFEIKKPFIRSVNGNLYLFSKDDKIFNSLMRYCRVVLRKTVTPYNDMYLFHELPNGDVRTLNLGHTSMGYALTIDSLKHIFGVLRTKEINDLVEYNIFYETIKLTLDINLHRASYYDYDIHIVEIYKYFGYDCELIFGYDLTMGEDYGNSMFSQGSFIGFSVRIDLKGFSEFHYVVWGGVYELPFLDNTPKTIEYEKIYLYGVVDGSPYINYLDRMGFDTNNLFFKGEETHPLKTKVHDAY